MFISFSYFLFVSLDYLVCVISYELSSSSLILFLAMFHLLYSSDKFLILMTMYFLKKFSNGPFVVISNLPIHFSYRLVIITSSIYILLCH